MILKRRNHDRILKTNKTSIPCAACLPQYLNEVNNSKKILTYFTFLTQLSKIFTISIGKEKPINLTHQTYLPEQTLLVSKKYYINLDLHFGLSHMFSKYIYIFLPILTICVIIFPMLHGRFPSPSVFGYDVSIKIMRL